MRFSFFFFDRIVFPSISAPSSKFFITRTSPQQPYPHKAKSYFFYFSSPSSAKKK